MKSRKIIRFFFIVYLLIVIKLIVLKYPVATMRDIVDNWEKGVILEGLDTANFQFFKTIRMYIVYSYKLNSFENLVGNIVVFIPFGFLFPLAAGYGPGMKLGKRIKNLVLLKTLLNGFLLIFGIEIFQLFSAFGAFDVDDILLNCIGVLLGYPVFILYNSIRKRRGKRY